MSIDTQTPEQPEMKTVALEDLVVPEILTFNDIQLPATHRCDRCKMQAWVEVEMAHVRTEKIVGDTVAFADLVFEEVDEHRKETLLFCAHHYRDSEAVLKATAVRIVDYRGTLEKQEKAGGPAL